MAIFRCFQVFKKYFSNTSVCLVEQTLLLFQRVWAVPKIAITTCLVQVSMESLDEYPNLCEEKFCRIELEVFQAALL